MTTEEFEALPVVPHPGRQAIWLEPNDQRGLLFPETGEEWAFGRFDGILCRWQIRPPRNLADKPSRLP